MTGHGHLVGSAALFALLAAPVGAVDFTTETWCDGEIVFSNEDGTAEIYEVKLWYDDGRYSLVSHELSTGEVLEDVGECDMASEDVCRHYIADREDDKSDAYAFMLSPMGDGRFLYKEIWLDGSQGRGC